MPNNTQSLLLKAALRYARMGWPVFPLNGKKPALKDIGSTAASTDERQIKAWWTAHPNANIGAATGHKFWVLDIDTKSGGDYSLEELEEHHGKLPDTVQQVTGTGGKHILFALTGTEVRNSQSDIAPGLDTRGTGGYIVVAPSIHPDTGRPYVWDGAKELHEQPILAAPDWLTQLLKRDVGADQHRASVVPLKIPKGQQHATLVSLAGTLRNRGLEEGEIFESLKIINQSRCTEPGPVNNIRQIAESVCKYPPGKLPFRRQAEEEIHSQPVIEQLDAALQTILRPSEANELIPLLAQLSTVKREVYIERIREKIGAPLRMQSFNKAIREEAQRQRPIVMPGRASVTRADWRDMLIVAANGAVRPVLANAMTAIRHAPEWSGVLAFDEFSVASYLRKAIPGTSSHRRTWTDNDDLVATEWLQHNGIMVGDKITAQAVERVSKEFPFHPVRDYINAIAWDGEPRLDTWLTDYLGARPSDSIDDEGEETQELKDWDAYIRAVGSKWLISAIARIYQPGCKVDTSLILEGKQGARKSTALKVLGGDWFTDEIADLGSKDAAIQTQGVWIIEIAELDSMGRPEVGKVKSFLSRSTDRFRPPYGKRTAEFPRQCVFAGTVNHSTYLKDETGGRRFWPISCGEINISGLEDIRDQLLAEARVRVSEEAPWWIDEKSVLKMAQRQQEERYASDPWDASVLEFALKHYDENGRLSVSIPEVLAGLKIDQARWTQVDSNRIARCLRADGWERFQLRDRDRREWRYRKLDGQGKMFAKWGVAPENQITLTH